MRRALWFAAGAGAGIYAMVRGRRAAEVFTVDGLRDRLQAVGVGARIFRDEIAAGHHEKQTELRERYAAAYDSTPQLTAGSGAGLDTPSLVPRDGYSTSDSERIETNDEERGQQ